MHFVGHVSNEELVAYYELADLFLCASEHEGFCVPLVEAFHMGVPVLAYAATAVPATMDGAGILFTNKDPLHVARADGRGRRRSAACRIDRRGTARRARSARAKDFAGTLLRFVDDMLSAPRAPHPQSPSISGSSSTPREELEETRGCIRPCGLYQARCRRRTRMIVNQWVPAAHKGDAIGDSARRVRDLLRGMGHQSELYAMTIDDDLRGDVRPFTDPGARGGDLTIFHFALVSPMTAAFASLPRGACCSITTSRRRTSSRRTTRRSSGWRCSGARN